MVFQFEHVGIDDARSKWDLLPFRLSALKASLGRWQAGLAYVYQGEELGMTNQPFGGVEDFRDIESLNHYRAPWPRAPTPSTC
jgi:oligo-1,6-glucosidase